MNETDKQTDDAIRATARELLRVLETPINGQPSITVRNRANALRLIQASFEEIWKAVSKE